MDSPPIWPGTVARWVWDPKVKTFVLKWEGGRAGDKDTTTVAGAAASAQTAQRNPLTGLYW